MLETILAMLGIGNLALLVIAGCGAYDPSRREAGRGRPQHSKALI